METTPTLFIKTKTKNECSPGDTTALAPEHNVLRSLEMF